MVTTKATFEDMGSEWPLSLGCETTSQAGNADNNGILDLQLFPDLQGMAVKNSYSRSVSQVSSSGSTQVIDIDDPDDELIGYFTRGDSAPAKVKVETRHQNAHLLTKPGMVKVVSLRQGVVNDSGKIVVVEEKQPRRTSTVDLTFSTGNPIPIVDPGSPCSSAELEDCDSVSGERTHYRGEQLCMTKNAIMARENRLKKKNYIQNLETSVETLGSENSALRKELSETKQTVETLRSEVTYLKSVLGNSSTLAKLLENIPMIPGLAIGKSDAFGVASNALKQTSRKRPAQVEENDSLNSDEECDCHPDKNVCMCSKENKFSKSKKFRHHQDGKQAPDHSYASDNSDEGGPGRKQAEKPQKGQTSPSEGDDIMSGGVCLHVSGSSVSLEFCSSCSKQAKGGRRKNSK